MSQPREMTWVHVSHTSVPQLTVSLTLWRY